MPTPEVAAAVRDHHVYQDFQHILDLAAFNSLSKLLTLKAWLRGARVIMLFSGWSLIEIILLTPPKSQNS